MHQTGKLALSVGRDRVLRYIILCVCVCVCWCVLCVGVCLCVLVCACLSVCEITTDAPTERGTSPLV